MTSSQSFLSSSRSEPDSLPGVLSNALWEGRTKQKKSFLLRENSALRVANILWGRPYPWKEISSHQKTIANMPIHFSVEGTKLFIQDIQNQTDSRIRREFSRLLADSRIQTVHFDPAMDGAKKRILANILAKNYPLVEVLRLIPGNTVANVSFAGVKKLNDTYGQNFVDRLLSVTKAKILQSAEEYVKIHGKSADHIRLVRDDYKNLTLSVPAETPIDLALFSGVSSKKSFLDRIISDENFHMFMENFAKEKNKDVNEIKKDILRIWDFGVWVSWVEAGVGNKQKLHAFAQAELVSRDGLRDAKIAVKTFDETRPLRFAREAVQQEEAIVRKWENRNFLSEWINYPVVLSVDEQKFLHPELLRQVRKNGDETKITPKELGGEVKKYIDTLNAGFDFITPSHNLDDDLADAEKMSDDFWKGVIQRESLIKNFKGVSTKEHFMHETSVSKGVRMFVDIKDMGIQNLQSFQDISRRMVSKTIHPDDLLSGGREVTDSFRILVRKIRESHSGVRIALWGDEVYLFFPGASPKETDMLLQSVHEKLQMSQLEGRISHSRETQNGEKIFKKLDESTVLHKILETMLAKKRMLLYGKQKMKHETIMLEIWLGRTETEMLESIPLLQKKWDSLIQQIAQGESVQSTFSVKNRKFTIDYNNGILHLLFI